MTAEEIRNQLLKEIDQGWGRFVDGFNLCRKSSAGRT